MDAAWRSCRWAGIRRGLQEYGIGMLPSPRPRGQPATRYRFGERRHGSESFLSIPIDGLVSPVFKPDGSEGAEVFSTMSGRYGAGKDYVWSSPRQRGKRLFLGQGMDESWAAKAGGVLTTVTFAYGSRAGERGAQALPNAREIKEVAHQRSSRFQETCLLGLDRDDHGHAISASCRGVGPPCHPGAKQQDARP